MKAKVYLSPPEDFKIGMEVAGCFCEHEKRILLLQRAPFKIEELRWGIPAGKLEPNETAHQAACRELFEEVGIKDVELSYIGANYIRRPEVDFVFHLFFISFHKRPILQLNTQENIQLTWVSLDEAFKLPLISGAQEVLSYFHDWKCQS